MAESLSIAQLMTDSGVAFGTSGARGRVEDMSDDVCYAYTTAFLQHLSQEGGIAAGTAVAIGGDLRPSTPRILGAVARAVADQGHTPINCGALPSPALALYGLQHGMPSIMVTGSHIPDDRNGIKFNTAEGEILKRDEAAIKAQQIDLPPGLFDASGMLRHEFSLPPVDSAASDEYVSRYLEFFPDQALAGLRVGLYEHSGVGRDLIARILEALGAELVRLGRSDTFIPVDTEAVRAEDIRSAIAWSQEHRLDALVSTDGDADRPLVGDEHGNWFRGDVAGILCARYLNADAVVTPVSSNSAVEKSGWFATVERTRIGSPFVIEGMAKAADAGARNVVGYEANGGFLTWTAIEKEGRTLPALPTRDAVIVALTLLVQARKAGAMSKLLEQLPSRVTASDRVKGLATERSREHISRLTPATGEELTAFANLFGDLAGEPVAADTTDGLRVSFDNGEVIHLRPSGNAPELRCYVEADSAARAASLLAECMVVLGSWA